MNLFATYVFGSNSYAIWEFGAAVLTFIFTMGLVVMGVSLIRRLIDQ